MTSGVTSADLCDAFERKWNTIFLSGSCQRVKSNLPEVAYTCPVDDLAEILSNPEDLAETNDLESLVLA